MGGGGSICQPKAWDSVHPLAPSGCFWHLLLTEKLISLTYSEQIYCFTHQIAWAPQSVWEVLKINWWVKFLLARSPFKINLPVLIIVKMYLASSIWFKPWDTILGLSRTWIIYNIWLFSYQILAYFVFIYVKFIPSDRLRVFCFCYCSHAILLDSQNLLKTHYNHLSVI